MDVEERAAKGDPSNLARQFHLKEEQEDRHTRLDDEERAPSPNCLGGVGKEPHSSALAEHPEK